MALASSLACCVFSPARLTVRGPSVSITACSPEETSSPQSRPRLRRRRRLKKPDLKSQRHENYWDPHLERQERRTKEQGMHLNYDVEQLKLRSDNTFELILELAEEANSFLVNHPEEAIHKRPALKAISDRMNESGTGDVADAYLDATFEFLEDLGRFNMH